MKQNILIISILTILLLSTNFIAAYANNTEVTVSLVGTSEKLSGTAVATSSTAAWHAKSQQYAHKFSVLDIGTGYQSPYYNATVGTTFNVSGMTANDYLYLYLKNSSWHLANSVTGQFLY